MEITLAEIIANSQRQRGEELLRCFTFAKFNRRGRIGIDDFLVFTKRGELRNQIAGGIHGERIAIKHQLIVAADEVAIADWLLMSSCEPRHHFVPDRWFMQTKRRRA